MSREAPETDRRMPYHFNRAATAIVRSRTSLDAAGDEARAAMVALADLQGADFRGVTDPMELMTRLRRLGEVVALLERSQNALASAWPVTWDAVDASTTTFHGR
jgi:hypothetical protein